jgi:hypothetical protein
MPIETSKDNVNQGLRRAAYAIGAVALPTLDAVLKSWTDRLLPSIAEERGLLDK